MKPQKVIILVACAVFIVACGVPLVSPGGFSPHIRAYEALTAPGPTPKPGTLKETQAPFSSGFKVTPAGTRFPEQPVTVTPVPSPSSTVASPKVHTNKANENAAKLREKIIAMGGKPDISGVFEIPGATLKQLEAIVTSEEAKGMKIVFNLGSGPSSQAIASLAWLKKFEESPSLVIGLDVQALTDWGTGKEPKIPEHSVGLFVRMHSDDIGHSKVLKGKADAVYIVCPNPRGLGRTCGAALDLLGNGVSDYLRIIPDISYFIDNRVRPEDSLETIKEFLKESDPRGSATVTWFEARQLEKEIYLNSTMLYLTTSEDTKIGVVTFKKSSMPPPPGSR